MRTIQQVFTRQAEKKKSIIIYDIDVRKVNDGDVINDAKKSNVALRGQTGRRQPGKPRSD